MRILNFLPQDYLTKRGRRQANLVCVVIGGGAVLLAAAVTGLTLLRAAGTAWTRALLDRQYAEASKQIDQLKELEVRKEGLLHKVELSTDLLERVPRSRIVAHLTNALPPNTSIQVLTMATKEVKGKPAKAAEAGPKAGAAKDRKRPAPAAPPPEKAKTAEVQFRLDGLAETDVAVAEYISRLGGDPLFQHVNLQFSEEFPYQEGVKLRRFEIVFTLAPEARKALETPPGASPAGPPPPAARPLASARGES
jgi:Tfp pilus assembly protein PilN